MEPRRRHERAGDHHQSHPAREPGPAVGSRPPFSSRRERPAPGLLQKHARQCERSAHGDQHRPPPRPARDGQPAARRARPGSRQAVSGARAGLRGTLPLERPSQLRRGQSSRDGGAGVPFSPPRAQRARLRVLPVIATTPRHKKPEPFQLEEDPLWYKDALVYELHVRAFMDSDADGSGDFRGLVEKLPYLQDLGVNALWLLPFYPSPMRDDGYDIADYTNVNPMYGTLGDANLLDAVPYLYEREGTNGENLPETHEFLKELRRHVDGSYRNRMLLAEANQWPEDAVSYFGQGDECHMSFHFPLMPRLFMAIRMEDRFPIVDILAQTPTIPETAQWALFLRNHDELTLEMVTDEERDYMYRAYTQDRLARLNLGIRRRLAPLLGNDRRRIELMNGLLLSFPGTPVLYYGDELGMGDNVFLGDRNGVRTPMQWS